jgi:hypothetical protein
MDLIPLSPLVSLLGALAEPLAGALAVVVAGSTLAGGVGHYSGLLMGKPKADVDLMTAIGFFGGLTVSLLIVLVVLVV